MLLSELRTALAADAAAALHLLLPDGDMVPPHFHVTEVGRVRKDFVDCGGTVRASETCLIQVWVAGDTHHRLSAGKLLGILELAGRVGVPADAPVEAEYDIGNATQYPLTGVEGTPSGLLLHLGGKHTACLAPDRCGVGECC